MGLYPILFYYMRALKIIDCSNGLYWYRDMIGAYVPFHRKVEECYMSREPDGYVNIVEFSDADVVEVPDDTIMYQISASSQQLA